MERKIFLYLLMGVIGTVLVFSYKTQNDPQKNLSGTGEFAGVSLRLDYATTNATRALGLGGKKVPEGYGMLFLFKKEDFYGFWMKDTLVPLDLFWFDSQGHLVYMATDVATSTYPNVFYPNAPARYVLETAAGFARTHHVKVGMPLMLKNFPIVLE
jgi:uncharacterized membrane protein (UPF0127 family)